MKRGGLFVAALFLISGVLRISGPGATAPAPQGVERTQKTEKANAGKNTPEIPYVEKFNAQIKAFYGVAESDSGQDNSLASFFKALQTPQDSSKGGPVQFVIAILPDPVHTHLGLLFDRGTEALQQAAQGSDYVFDRAIMPWDHTPNTQSSGVSIQEGTEEQAQRESYPGLLIFRRDVLNDSRARNPSLPHSGSSRKGPLFVLVVGETPTAGLNTEQFRNAERIVREIRGAYEPSEDAKKAPLLILGPSFSGSLGSLGQELQRLNAEGIRGERFIYSGTVTASDSIYWFQGHVGRDSHFASFEENDEYARNEFLLFACDRGYLPNEVATLSEDETVFGALNRADGHEATDAKSETRIDVESDARPEGKPASAEFQTATSSTTQLGTCPNKNGQKRFDENVLKLHFPREIYYFRSTYQKVGGKQQSSHSSGVPTLPMDLDESGSDDDAVAPYAVAQMSLSQEAVMLGIVSELQKHHIKFTLLFASDPLDELFLASYLRKAYAQGRIVITAPDLLFAREGDAALQGVLGLNSYALIPGLSDRLCRQRAQIKEHEDRIFVSSLSVGTFNAMSGLLAVQDASDKAQTRDPTGISPDNLPHAPYAEYGTPSLHNLPGKDYCEERPLLWLTILGRDGFWPIAGLSNRGLHSADAQIPIASLEADGQPPSTLETASGSYSLLSSTESPETKPRTPPGWNIAYCFCLILLVTHAVLSWTGSILADSEASAQFARTTDCRGTLIIGLGALALTSAFVLVMCTRSPRVDWAGFPGLTALMWLPYPVFAATTIWDLRNLRHQRVVAVWFTVILCVMTAFQIFLAWIPSGSLRVYWSNRMLHITSGVSPALPVLLLLAGGYWWVWISLRGVCLVDLRRPRLPEKQDLPIDSYRISDDEGEELRRTAHPFVFSWQIMIPVMVLVGVSLTALDRGHPVQTIEGKAYDWGFTVLLGVMIAAFLGCLLKLVRTWLKCRQVLAGLDRLPLRVAFSRMKDLSWHSFWNPGGSTLRETYKVMSRAMENLTRLLGLVENWSTPLTDGARYKARIQIRKTLDSRQLMLDAYWKVFADRNKKGDSASSRNGRKNARLLVHLEASGRAILALLNPAHFLRTAKILWQEKKAFFKDDFKRGWRLKTLMKRVESLQKEMAKTGAILIRDVLKPIWDEDEGTPAVSSDDRLAKTPLLPFRAMAEEYAALVYVNFLVSVLLRIRTLVISAGGLYVFIVMAINVYPFEPHPALQTLAVVLLLVMGVTVGFVYAEMHREVILSRLTSTSPGELGLDFWIKFASAAAIPVFSLLAAQFPSINQFLFSWLEPALQAMK
jgi:hypothetical protein